MLQKRRFPPLNRAARLAPVIALAVGISAMAVLTAGILLDYTIERDRVERVRDGSDAIQADRVRERLEAKYDDDDAVTVRNLWGGDSALTGIVVVCDDGTILTGEANHTVGAGRTATIRMLPDINSVRAGCS